MVVSSPPVYDRLSLRQRLALRGIDGVTILVLPAVLFLLAVFVYPFIYGLILSFTPKEGGMFANYQKFFSDPFLYDTILTTLWLAVPVTVISIALALPIAFRVRLMTRQRLLTTILVLPVTLGTVLVAEGLLNYLGPQGWFSRTLMLLGMIDRHQAGYGRAAGSGWHRAAYSRSLHIAAH